MQEIISPFRDRSQSPIKEEGWALNPVQEKRVLGEESPPLESPNKQHLRSYIFDEEEQQYSPEGVQSSCTSPIKNDNLKISVFNERGEISPGKMKLSIKSRLLEHIEEKLHEIE